MAIGAGGTRSDRAGAPAGGFSTTAGGFSPRTSVGADVDSSRRLRFAVRAS